MRGKTIVPNIRVRARATARADRGNRSVFPIPSLTRALIRPPYTILLPPRGLVVDSECKTRANRSNQRVAMFAQLGSTTILARCFGVFFLPYFLPILCLSLFHSHIHAHAYRSYQKLRSNSRFLRKFETNLSIICTCQIYYLLLNSTFVRRKYLRWKLKLYISIKSVSN